MDGQGPLLVLEPPPRLEFSNSTGGRLDCTARGSPMPAVHWMLADGTPANSIAGLRYQLPNGSLTFPAFSAAEFRPDVHRAVYRCVASNALGRVLSRDVRLRAGMWIFRKLTVLVHWKVEVYLREWHQNIWIANCRKETSPKTHIMNFHWHSSVTEEYQDGENWCEFSLIFFC
jgi:hypothetical protein